MNQIAIRLSKIMQPQDDAGMKGHSGLPYPPGVSAADDELGWQQSLAELAALVEAGCSAGAPAGRVDAAGDGRAGGRRARG